jgi:hypothetical protein
LHGEVPRNWDFLPDDGEEDGVARWKSHWDNFTAAYTDAGLTYTTDKLAAVAGIARAFQQASSHTYVAGMWEEHIPAGALLWRTNSRAPRPTFRGAPSWSWASIDGELSYGAVFVKRPDDSGPGHVLHKPRTELVGLHVTLPPEDPHAIFGEVQEAVVCVRSRMFRADYALQDAGKELRVLRLVHLRSGGEGEVGWEGRQFGGFSEHKFDAVFDAPADGVRPVVLCVLSTVDSYLDGLVLIPSEGRAGVYERVGVFQFSGREYPQFQEIANLEETVVSIR